MWQYHFSAGREESEQQMQAHIVHDEIEEGKGTLTGKEHQLMLA